MAKLPGLYFLKSYPHAEIWRLFVDGRLWAKENGWQGYESREPGSLNAALESLCSSALEVEDDFELTVDFIKSIHKKCGKKVSALRDKGLGEPRTNEPVSFGIPANRVSIKGIEEFLALAFLIEGKATFGPGEAGVFAPRFTHNYFQDLKPEQIPALAKKIYYKMSKGGHSSTSHFFLAVRQNVNVYLETITQSYNKEIKDAKTIDDKLRVIAKHIRQYEVLHPFKDANGRTFANNLLNILLMQQGLPPATFYEPNVFDLYSADELTVVIKEAIFNTMNIIENHEKGLSLYGYTSTLEDRTKFSEKLDSPSYQSVRNIHFSKSSSRPCEKQALECIGSLDEKYPLHRAVIYLGEPREIKQLVSINLKQLNKQIKQGAPPLYVGKTPLQLAVMMKNIPMLDELINQNADLSIQDYDGKTALHYAAEYGNMQIMGKTLNSLMTQKNAIKVLNIKDAQGKTAFHYAAEFGSPEVVEFLKATNFILINELDNLGSSALTIAYRNNKLSTFDKLLNAEVNISSELLEEIYRRDDKESLRTIIERNEKILGNKEAFSLAVRLGSIKLVRKFLQAGMDIDAPLTEENETALMLAVSKGDARLTKYLLKKEANTSLTDVNGASSLHLAFYPGEKYREALINLLVEKDKSMINKKRANFGPPIFSAVYMNDYCMVKLLLDKGAEIRYEDFNRNNILHTAMSRGCDLPLIQTLANKDNSLLHNLNADGRNPLHEALNTRPYNILEKENTFIALGNLLIEENVNLNSIDKDKKTLLDYALSMQCCHLGVQLMRAGAQTNITSPSNFLKKSDGDFILENAISFKNKLNKKLNDNPLIAMAQLNDLYLQVKNNTIRTPNGFTQDKHSLFKAKPSEAKAHDHVLLILKALYDDKLHELLNSHYGSKNYQNPNEKSCFFQNNLRFLIKNQEISKKIDKPTAQVIEGNTYKLKW